MRAGVNDDAVQDALDHAQITGVTLSPYVVMAAVWAVWWISWWAAAAWRDRAVSHAPKRNQILYRVMAAVGAMLLFRADRCLLDPDRDRRHRPGIHLVGAHPPGTAVVRQRRAQGGSSDRRHGTVRDRAASDLHGYLDRLLRDGRDAWHGGRLGGRCRDDGRLVYQGAPRGGIPPRAAGCGGVRRVRAPCSDADSV